MSDDAPNDVNDERPLELDEFPSEAAFPPQAEPASGAATPVDSPGSILRSVALDAHRVEFAARSAAPGDTPEAPGPHRPPDGEAGEEAVRGSTPFGPATVTEFPVRQHMPAAIALSSLPDGPVTLVELIERRGGFDWREAVAVIHQICLYLRDHAPQAPILLDQRAW
jgi:hypothetical protein